MLSRRWNPCRSCALHTHQTLLLEHLHLTRRYFVKLGAVGLLAQGLWPRLARGESPANALTEKQARFATYLTPQDKFEDVSRGTPVPHKLPNEKKSEAGLTRDAW